MTKLPKGVIVVGLNDPTELHNTLAEIFGEPKLKPRTIDVRLSDEGSLIGFTPISEAAQDWFRLHVEAEDWQWMGDTLWIDHRFARDLMQGIVDDGLELGA